MTEINLQFSNPSNPCLWLLKTIFVIIQDIWWNFGHWLLIQIKFKWDQQNCQRSTIMKFLWVVSHRQVAAVAWGASRGVRGRTSSSARPSCRSRGAFARTRWRAGAGSRASHRGTRTRALLRRRFRTPPQSLNCRCFPCKNKEKIAMVQNVNVLMNAVTSVWQ
jgi:hypothetical protein